MCLAFARNCAGNGNNLTSDIFPRNSNNVNTRQHETFYVPHAKTDRFAKSAIPYKARLLNTHISSQHNHRFCQQTHRLSKDTHILSQHTHRLSQDTHRLSQYTNR